MKSPVSNSWPALSALPAWLDVTSRDDQRLPSARIDLQHTIPGPEALGCLSRENAVRLGMLPIALWWQAKRSILLLACADVADTAQRERVANYLHSDHELHFCECASAQLPSAIEEFYRIDAMFGQLLSPAAVANWQSLDATARPELSVQLVNALLVHSVRMRVSDIHLSPQVSSIRVRLRIDGVLLDYAELDKHLLNSILVRIKVMAQLDIAESRFPQDGQFTRLINGQLIDFRVSTFPTVDGENTVVRLIDSNGRLDSLRALRLPDAIAGSLSALVRKPDGLIIVCGPTGAGKSTTLFALLAEIDKNARSVMTLEDPVEHRIEGIRQTSIDNSRQWGYAQGLRALLRQDPDVLLIGEIRDAESCAMAFRAVSTGHQVLTTVHAGSAHSALHRLREFNATRGALALGLTAIVAQRLLRLRCEDCQVDVKTCHTCHGTGYYGRQLIVEILEITEPIRSLLAQEAPVEQIHEASKAAGFKGLRDQANALLALGKTGVEEVERVLGDQP